jgi:hypothetical protein
MSATYCVRSLCMHISEALLLSGAHVNALQTCDIHPPLPPCCLLAHTAQVLRIVTVQARNYCNL